MSVYEKLESIWPKSAMQGVTVLVAVSGGADSVALTRLLHQVSPDHSRLVLSHFNHRLRGKDSDADEMFVQNMAVELGCELIVERAEAVKSGSNHGHGLEANARQQRYAFLEKAAKRCGARYVATAHTKDDQVETILQRIFRGSSLRGLAGIPIQRKLRDGITLMRPLLQVSRSELQEFLSELDQPYRVDQSNFSPQFTRNRVRHELIPLIQDIFSKTIANGVLALGNDSRQMSQLVRPLVDQLIEQGFRRGGQSAIAHGLEVDCKAIRHHGDTILIEAFIQIWNANHWPLQQMNRQKWIDLAELALGDKNHGSINLPGDLKATRKGNSLFILEVDDGSKLPDG